MAARALRFVPAILLLSFCSTAFSQTFPDIYDINFYDYQTEVQITDVIQETSAYATEYYNTFDQNGELKIYSQGNQQLVYYDNSTFQITEINGFNCTATDADISTYYYTPIYHGWLNKDPLIIGPSAALWYALTRRNDFKSAKTEEVRSIKCDKFTLPVSNKYENLTYEYYFAPSSWTTPYSLKNLRVPIRIRIVGNSSRYSAGSNTFAPVEQINDFVYFKPSIDDFKNLLPPVGLGCKLKKRTFNMPFMPSTFQYSAEVVDLLGSSDHEDIEIQIQKTYFDYDGLLARRDIYSRKKGYKSNLYDFNTGTVYKIVDDGSCEMAILRNADFQNYDNGMVGNMKFPKEVLNLDGEFYEMGKRIIRGIRCDTFESVQFNKHFKGKKYDKLVVTAYFTESEINVGINGEMESRIPVCFLITGYETPDKKTLQLQYNIFEFDDVIRPEMYSSFRLDKCYTKPDTKAHFVLILPAGSVEAAEMENQDEMVIRELRASIAKYAKVREMRIPYLRADYKTTGVNITGVLLERPPALLQFYVMGTGPTVTRDPDLQVIPEAENTEQCAYACVDDEYCKGFYFCGKACFLKSTDPFDKEENSKATDLGECTEYIRAVTESSNFYQSYLNDALENLKEAVISMNLTVSITIPGGVEILTVQDLIIEKGPHTKERESVHGWDISKKKQFASGYIPRRHSQIWLSE